jgi:magnesium transporter
MPEIGWRWAYPALWAVILASVGGMMVFFRSKKWM